MTRTTKNTRGNNKIQRSLFGALENLESRQMFSAAPFSIYTVPIGSGQTELVCQIAQPSQSMSVVRSPDGIQFNLNGQVDDVAGNFAYLSIIAQGGDNSIVIGPNMLTPTCVWAGNGNDVISTGASNDDLRATGGDTTLIATGGTNDQLFGGWGTTNIWESETGNYYSDGSGNTVTHFFSSFVNTNDITLDGGPTLGDPGMTTGATFTGTWNNLSYLPLFTSNGPQLSDVQQGDIGDCWFVATLGSVAQTDPQAIRNMITPLGDGTYMMEFFNNGTPEFVRVNGDLPVNENGNLFGANDLDMNGNFVGTWVPMMEKGMAYYQSWLNDAAPDYHWIDDNSQSAFNVYADLGGTNDSGTGMFGGEDTGMFANEYYFAGWINWQLQQGNAISIGFGDGNENQFFAIPNVLINDHQYTLYSETFDSAGDITGFWVRNPWGYDVATAPTNGYATMAAAGHNDGSDDGFVWLSVQQAYDNFNDLNAASV